MLNTQRESRTEPLADSVTPDRSVQAAHILTHSTDLPTLCQEPCARYRDCRQQMTVVRFGSSATKLSLGASMSLVGTGIPIEYLIVIPQSYQTIRSPSTLPKCGIGTYQSYGPEEGKSDREYATIHTAPVSKSPLYWARICVS